MPANETKKTRRKRTNRHTADDVSFVIRSFKQVVKTFRDGLAECDIPEPKDDFEIIKFYRRYFESEAAFFRLRDIRFHKNAMVHDYGYDRVGELHPDNRIKSRGQFDEAYAFVRREIAKAVENLKQDYLSEEIEEEVVVEEDTYCPEPIVETADEQNPDGYLPWKLALAAGVVLVLLGLFANRRSSTGQEGQKEAEETSQATSVPAVKLR